jgi:hypothetical protein
MSRAHLLEMNEAIRELNGGHERVFTSDFTIWPLDEQHPFPSSVPRTD